MNNSLVRNFTCACTGKSQLGTICLHYMVIYHPSNYTACSFSKCGDLKGSAMLFLIVVSVFSGAAAIIYALSLLVLLYDLMVPLEYSSFPHNSIFRVSCSYRIILLIQEGSIKPKHILNILWNMHAGDNKGKLPRFCNSLAKSADQHWELSQIFPTKWRKHW